MNDSWRIFSTLVLVSCNQSRRNDLTGPEYERCGVKIALLWSMWYPSSLAPEGRPNQSIYSTKISPRLYLEPSKTHFGFSPHQKKKKKKRPKKNRLNSGNTKLVHETRRPLIFPPKTGTATSQHPKKHAISHTPLQSLHFTQGSYIKEPVSVSSTQSPHTPTPAFTHKAPISKRPFFNPPRQAVRVLIATPQDMCTSTTGVAVRVVECFDKVP